MQTWSRQAIEVQTEHHRKNGDLFLFTWLLTSCEAGLSVWKLLICCDFPAQTSRRFTENDLKTAKSRELLFSLMPCLGESVPVCRRASLNAHQTDALQEQKSTVDPTNSESLDKLNKIEIWGRKKRFERENCVSGTGDPHHGSTAYKYRASDVTLSCQKWIKVSEEWFKHTVESMHEELKRPEGKQGSNPVPWRCT